jgi:hypothetical protein
VLKVLTVLAHVFEHKEDLQFDCIVVYTVVVSVLSMVFKLSLCVIKLHMFITLVPDGSERAAFPLAK